MRIERLMLASGLLAGALTLSAPAQAQMGPLVLSSGHRAGLCLDIKGGTSEAIVWSCHGGSNQQVSFSGYGEVRIAGRCLGTSGNRSGAAIVAQGCNGGRGQRWANTREGWLKNEEGWCADIQGGGGAGTAVIAWECKKGFGALVFGDTNQRWSFARFFPASALSQRAQQLVGPNAGRLVSKADLNAAGVIAPGGANVIAAGGGNVIAPGGANVIAPGGANVIAAGGGNILVPQSGLIAGQ